MCSPVWDVEDDDDDANMMMLMMVVEVLLTIVMLLMMMMQMVTSFAIDLSLSFKNTCDDRIYSYVGCYCHLFVEEMGKRYY